MRVSKKARLQSWLRDKAPEEVTEAHFTGLLVDLAPVTESNLRRMLRDTGYPLQTIVRGVDQSSLHALRETLLALARAYEAGDRRARAIVITAKDHAKFAAAKHPEKQEMVAWMLTWLENPGVFAPWVAMRARLLKLDGLDGDDIALPVADDLGL